MSSLSSRRRSCAGVFVAWPAAWRYGACSIGKRVTGNVGGAGFLWRALPRRYGVDLDYKF